MSQSDGSETKVGSLTCEWGPSVGFGKWSGAVKGGCESKSYPVSHMGTPPNSRGGGYRLRNGQTRGGGSISHPSGGGGAKSEPPGGGSGGDKSKFSSARQRRAEFFKEKGGKYGKKGPKKEKFAFYLYFALFKPTFWGILEKFGNF